MPSEKLESLLEYVKELELSDKSSEHSVLRYFGAWSDMDDELFEEFTARLPEKRLQESRAHVRKWKRQY